MSFLFWLILALLLIDYSLKSAADLLDLKSFAPKPPAEFADVFDEERYSRARDYQEEGVRFDLIQRSVLLFLTVTFIAVGGFNVVDLWARNVSDSEIGRGLVFLAILGTLRSLLSLPFSIYSTFVIEEKFGFNKTTPRVFFTDLLKSLLLTAAIGAPVFAAILYFFGHTGSLGWLYAWIAVSAFQLILGYLAPALLLPLFNKFKPLEPGPLKDAIETYFSKLNFHVKAISVMDGSKRSTKANAFFAGFGRFRRLALFDTLVAKQTVEELVAVLAHEVGHFRKKHVLQFTLLGIGTAGLAFFALSLLIGNADLAAAFRMDNVAVYSTLVFAGFLYSPASRLISMGIQALSRRFEFEADQFSAETFGKPDALASALKKLSADHLSNVTPHRLKVVLEYSHPPVLERIEALKALGPSAH